MKHAATTVHRGLLSGLALGAFGAALLLGGLSLINATRDCEFPGSLQCLFEEETYRSVARMQALAATGLALLGAGVAIFRRRAQ